MSRMQTGRLSCCSMIVARELSGEPRHNKPGAPQPFLAKFAGFPLSFSLLLSKVLTLVLSVKPLLPPSLVCLRAQDFHGCISLGPRCRGASLHSMLHLQAAVSECLHPPPLHASPALPTPGSGRVQRDADDRSGGNGRSRAFADGRSEHVVGVVDSNVSS